jgi:transcriptional regulator GlxA family with amidase domain
MAGLGDADRLEAYIEANWHRPMTVEDVAQACGVSVRSVFARFRQRRGVSPAAYLRDLRLSNARNLLLDPTGGSVIDVALKCGFASFGHFASRYREKFGELPSMTIARRPLR